MHTGTHHLPIIFLGLFSSGTKGPQRISKSAMFFVVLISCSALRGTNNAAYSFAFPVSEICFLEFFFFLSVCRCVERTQKRLITLLSLLAEHKAGSEGKPGCPASGWCFCASAWRRLWNLLRLSPCLRKTVSITPSTHAGVTTKTLTDSAGCPSR